MTGTGPSPSTPQRLDPPEAGEISGRLFPPLPTEADWTLDRVRAALDALEHPQDAYRTLHVGGTNGKGSVAAVWDAVLRESGHRVGLYTSPHLLEFNERFRIGGRPVEDAPLLAAAAQVRDPVMEHGLTFFEAVTVLAFHLFRSSAVEVAVVEVGLGGRLDATNVLHPEVCAVTNVGLDHAEYLGETLEEVALEKAAIARTGVPFVVGEPRREVSAILERCARARGAAVHRLDPGSIQDVEIGIPGSRFRLKTDAWGELSLETRLVGRHQVVNAALAVRGLELLAPHLRAEAAHVIRGVAATKWPGRTQVEAVDGRTWVLDVAHNPEGTAALAETLRELDLPEPRTVVFGCLGDKDWRGMLEPLRPWAHRAVLVAPPGSPRGRGWDPAPAERAFSDWAEDAGSAGIDEALARARALAGDGGTIVATGSHRLVGAVLSALGRMPFDRGGAPGDRAP